MTRQSTEDFLILEVATTLDFRALHRAQPERIFCGAWMPGGGVGKRGYAAPANGDTSVMDRLLAADEIFMCNSQFGIWPVSRCGHKMLDSWPLTQRLQVLLRQSGVHEGPA